MYVIVNVINPPIMYNRRLLYTIIYNEFQNICLITSPMGS